MRCSRADTPPGYPVLTLTKLTLDGRPRWYLFFGSRLPSPLVVHKPEAVRAFERTGRCLFYLHAEPPLLLKVKVDKYSPGRQLLRWIGRILLWERLLLQTDAHTEFRGNRRYRSAGLSPVVAHGWGVALNPLNRLGSVYVMDYLADAVSGKKFFEQAGEEERRAFLDAFCDDVVRLARHGLYSRDAHLDNLLVTGEGRFVWIDTRLSRLPFSRGRRKKVLVESVARKILGQEYREYVRARLTRLLG